MERDRSPRVETVDFGRRHGKPTQVEGQLARSVVFVGTVHHERQVMPAAAQRLEQRTTLGRVVSVARRQRKGYDRPSVRGNQMNLGSPSPTGLADRLGSVFKSPGAVWMNLHRGRIEGEGFDLMRTICSL